MDEIPSDFGRVYDEHVASVYGFLAYRVPSTHLAEDLTQATFERGLRGWSRFDPRKASERTWLLVIARNLLIDHFRRHHEEPVGEVDDRRFPAVEGPEQSLGATHELVAALAQLSDRDREVIALRYGGDLTGPEISELLDLSLASVQQILSRSLRRLRMLLDESGAVIRD
jgi:RNA polymerase sigma factor (sigma-70 family)